MFRWIPYVFIRFTLFLIVGILLYTQTSSISTKLMIGLFGVGCAIYVGLWQLQRTKFKKARLHVWYGVLALVITGSFGWLLMRYHTHLSQPTHIVQQANITYYSGKVASEVQTRTKNYRYILEVDKIVSNGKAKPATGKVLIYSSIEAAKPKYGDVLLIYGQPQPIKPPANPGEFDYRKYLALQQVHVQQFVKKRKFIIYQQHAGNPVMAASLQVRTWADSLFHHHVPGKQEYAIVSGLVLGIRDGLDNELKDAYAAAGAMHVLAVSGAHVIIVFQLIVMLLGSLKRFRYGNVLFAVAALLVLWFYAFITGLSASVLRAVIMFSFVVIGQAIRREGTLFNSLGLSAFLLLCLDPYLLQDVGAQLSYLAVAGIVYLYPKIYRWIETQNWLLDKIWESTCVSLAAQIAVLPLTLFYFHQFPTYFLLANLIMIPVSGCILYAGLALLATAWIPYVSFILSFALHWLTWLMNQVAFWTEKTPGALFQGIYLTAWELVLMYLLLVTVLLFFYMPQLRVWGVATLLLICITASQTYGKTRYRNQHVFAVYAIPGHSAIDIIDGQQHVFLADSAVLNNENQILFHLRNHWGNRQVLNTQKILFSQISQAQISTHCTPAYTLISWHGKRICILHKSTNLRIFKNQKIDYLIVQNNSLPTLKRFPSQVFGQVILDASNRYYLSKRLEKNLQQLQVSCHNVHENGAFLISF